MDKYTEYSQAYAKYQYHWRCPKCDSPDLDGDGFDMEGLEAWRTIVCGECGHMWDEIFKFSHNEERE